MKMKPYFVILVAGVFGLSAFVPSAEASASGTPVWTSDGVRTDVRLSQFTNSDKLVVTNISDHDIKVVYSDPTYGEQSIELAPGADNDSKPMCANDAYRDTYPVTVTFDADTSTPVTGTGQYNAWTGGYSNPAQLTDQVVKARAVLAKAKRAFASAKKALVKAKRSHKAAKIRKAKKQVRATRHQVLVARSRAYIALDNLRWYREQAAYCADKR